MLVSQNSRYTYSDSDQQLVVRVKIVRNQDKRLANIVEKGVLGNQDEKKRTCVWVITIAYVEFSSINSK